MNRVRTCVEWGIGKVTSTWRFCSLKRNAKLLASPIGLGKIYRVSALLTNFNTCCYGSLTGHFFGLAPPTLTTYIGGGVTPPHGFGV